MENFLYGKAPLKKLLAYSECALGRGNNLFTPGKHKSQRQKSTSADDGLSSINLACEQALLFGWVRQVSPERASEQQSRVGPRKGELAMISYKVSLICTSPRQREIPLAEKWRSGNQSWLITGQAGTRFVCVSNLVLRGIRLVPRTCFSPQSRRARLM